jgi:uncharacterized protein YjbI with pentapeptide repeats
MSDAGQPHGLLGDLGSLGTALSAVVTAIIALFSYFKITTHRDKVAAARTSFDRVVSSLASENEVERLAGAILLRRFFDPNSEVATTGIPGATVLRRFFDPKSEVSNRDTPYATEAVNVIAAILRNQQPGNFQKLLADGLAFAPSLHGADLQKTNLNNAYLGVRDDRKVVDLTKADFFGANLTEASLRGSDAREAVFFQAALTNTVLREADLREANFVGADLHGANFKGAKLTGADFTGATNLPQELKDHLDKDNKWNGPEVFGAPVSAISVYLSKPGCLDARQEKIVELIKTRLAANDLETVTTERSEYPTTSGLVEIRRRMSGCSGMIVFGFAELTVSDGLWRPDTREKALISGEGFPTSWVQIEAGMGSMIDLPLLLIVDANVARGVFDPTLSEHNIHRLATPLDQTSPEWRTWLMAVRERAAR